MSAYDSHDHELPPDEVHVHALSVGLLLKVFLALVALTVLTVITGNMSLWGMDLAIALVIATCKASLVCLFFMHLKYDRPFHGLIFLFSVMFVGLFLAFVALDKGEYEGDIHDRDFDKRAASEAAAG